MLITHVLPGQAAPGLIENDPALCSAIEGGRYSELEIILKNDYNTTLEDSYTLIRCHGADITDIDSKTRQILNGLLQQYVDIKLADTAQPNLHKLDVVDAKIILDRIHQTLARIKGHDELEARYKENLHAMAQKYTSFITKQEENSSPQKTGR